MIKKIIVFILLLMFFTNKAVAQEDDVLTIESFKTDITITQENKYMVKNEYDTLLIFGDNPKTNFFYKILYDNYSYKVKNNTINSKVEFEGLNPESDVEFGAFLGEKGTTLYFGDSYKRFNPKEKIKIEYYAILEEKQKGVYSYTICEEDYDVKKLEFSVHMMLGYEDKDLKFSLDGKNYSKELPNLKYEIKDNVSLVGSYTSTLKKGENLSFVLIDNEARSNTNSTITLIILGILTIILTLSLIIRIKLTKKKKSVL